MGYSPLLVFDVGENQIGGFLFGELVHVDDQIVVAQVIAAFTCHPADEIVAGFINGMPPYAYHRTISGSRDYYENYLIKFSMIMLMFQLFLH